MVNAYNYSGVTNRTNKQDDIPLYRRKIYECIRKEILQPFVRGTPKEVLTVLYGPNEPPDPYMTCNGVRIEESELVNVTSTAQGEDAWLCDGTIDAMMMFLESYRIHIWKSDVAHRIRAYGQSSSLLNDEFLEELVKLNSRQTVLAPSNHGTVHWGLSVINKSSYNISLYDSGNLNADFTDLLVF